MARTTPRKLYRTMQGKMVDIDKLRAANESTRAVGNMNVNARGDVLGPGNSVVRSKEEVMREYYEAPAGAVADTPAPKVATPTPIPQEKVIDTKVINPNKTVSTPNPVEVKQETKMKKIDVFKPKSTPKKTESKPSGIDAALEGIDE
tara:strand:+ start:593 stop:1033 length:441 start_codon:yes stop_codon:yes gene_type:complete